jgi:hypothetical protein
MGSTTNIDATIMPEISRNCQRLEGKYTTLQIALDVDNFRYVVDPMFFRPICSYTLAFGYQNFLEVITLLAQHIANNVYLNFERRL